MSSYKSKLSCSFAAKAGEERDRFRETFPLEAPSILDNLERAVSRQTQNVDLVGRTSDGFEVFWLEEAVCMGNDLFIVGILFEVRFTSALWLKFEWSKHVIGRSNPLSAELTMEEILDSLRARPRQI